MITQVSMTLMMRTTTRTHLQSRFFFIRKLWVMSAKMTRMMTPLLEPAMFQVCDEEGPNDKLSFGFLVYFFSFFLFISSYLLLVLGIRISDKGRKGREEQRMMAKTGTTPLALPYQPTISAYYRRLSNVQNGIQTSCRLGIRSQVSLLIHLTLHILSFCFS